MVFEITFGIMKYHYVSRWRRKLFHLLKCGKKLKAIFLFFYQQPNLAPFGILLDTTSNHTFLKKKISICFLSWLSAETSRPLASSSLSPFFFILMCVQYFQGKKKQTFQTIRVFVTIV